MRRIILAAMMSLTVLICCASSSWAFWPFTGNDQRKTHEALDVTIQTGAETAKEVRNTREDIKTAKDEISRNLQEGMGGLKKEMAEFTKAVKARKDPNIKPVLTALGLLLAAILLVMLIAVIIFSRKKFPEANIVKIPPTERVGKCSICNRPVKPENWKRHLRRSVCEDTGKKMGKKVELILA
jgi:Sec-independent protein translocase protein TatA